MATLLFKSQSPSPLKNQNGAALLLAIFCSLFLIFMALQVSEETINEYLSSTTGVKRVQSLYAAKACARLSLLRIKAYQQATANLSGAGPQAQSLVPLSMLNLIWQMPFTWPPTMGGDTSSSNKDDVKKTVGKSFLKFNFSSTITSEGGKIDINDLSSPSKVLRDKTRQQILDLLIAKTLVRDSEFAREYGDYDFQKMLNNIQDWMDEDQQSLNGGSENQYYIDFKSQFYPPNRPFKTLDELHMVEGVTDDIYNVIAPQITIFGVKGINVNQADQDTLRSLHPNLITVELATEIIKRRNSKELGGPFKNPKEFFDFIGSFGVKQEDIEKQSIPLFFGAEINFKIECMGISGGSKNPITKIIRAHVFDLDEVQTRLSESLVKDAQLNNPNPGGAPVTPPNPQCAGKQGEDLYQCNCQSKTAGPEKEQCLTAERNKAAAGGSQAPKVRQGQPPVVYWEVE